MSAEENKAIVRRALEELYTKRNLAILDELLAADYVHHWAGQVGWEATSPLRGPAAHKQPGPGYLSAFPDLSHTIEDMIAEGDRVMVRSTLRGTHRGDFPFGPQGSIKPTGKQVTYSSVTIWRISKGKIVEDWNITGMASLWRQLGAV